MSKDAYEYKSQWGHNSKCGLEVLNHEGFTLVIASELDDNPGVSVTNFAEHLATQVCLDLMIDPMKLVWVEHYPDFGKRPYFDPAHWDAATFEFDVSRGHFQDPAWFPVGDPQLQAMRRGELPDLPAGLSAWAARQLSTTGPVTPKCHICGFGIGSASLFPGLESFYSAGTNRRDSEEFDYGFHWRQGTDLADRWRVSYIRATGEVYATREYRPLVVVLGVVPPDEAEGGPYYRTLEHILDGWADHCGKPGGLEWVRDRLAMYPPGRAAEVSNANNQ